MHQTWSFPLVSGRAYSSQTTNHIVVLIISSNNFKYIFTPKIYIVFQKSEPVCRFRQVRINRFHKIKILWCMKGTYYSFRLFFNQSDDIKPVRYFEPISEHMLFPFVMRLLAVLDLCICWSVFVFCLHEWKCQTEPLTRSENPTSVFHNSNVHCISTFSMST